MRDGLPILDADAHVVEPIDIFGGLLPAGVPVMDLPTTQIALICFVLMWALILLAVPIGAATALAGLLGAALIIGSEPSLGMLGRLVEDKRAASRCVLHTGRDRILVVVE